MPHKLMLFYLLGFVALARQAPATEEEPSPVARDEIQGRSTENQLQEVVPEEKEDEVEDGEFEGSSEADPNENMKDNDDKEGEIDKDPEKRGQICYKKCRRVQRCSGWWRKNRKCRTVMKCRRPCYCRVRTTWFFYGCRGRRCTSIPLYKWRRCRRFG
ncbi:predicted protein [Nematostella vectensis]|uniref:Uncharacterized protein n=1 Tax=Nematostella vectensis TaxID=45351 RepID=A7SIQ2_NEMVE|nr:predicted protein [Nematostella vectensis]|eukprot:XP_001628491.1 predicted protein [Nematostella vectensis]